MFRVVVEVEGQKKAEVIVGNKTVSANPFLLDEYKFTNTDSEETSHIMSSNKSQTRSEIVFFAGNPTVDSIKGIFHLSKDTDSRLINIANGDEKSTTELWDTTIPVIFFYFL